jgi:hypothetical protein
VLGGLTLAAVFGALPVAAQSVAPSAVIPPTDPELGIYMPGSVEADLSEPPPQPVPAAPIFPDLVAPGRVAYEEWRDQLDERANLRFSLNYQQLYQYATKTLPGASFDSANGGWAALEAIWMWIGMQS